VNLSLPLDFIELAPAALSATSHIGPSTIQGAEQRGVEIPVKCPECGGIGRSRLYLVDEQLYLTIRSCECGFWRCI
jgi:hypothetical protein